MNTLLARAIASAVMLTLAPTGIAPAAPLQPAAARQEHLSLPPPKAGHRRPLVAVVADSAGAETADFVVPLGVLRESGLADVRALATKPGPVQLYRALKIQPDETLAAFDAASPEGADIVIVPAQRRPDSPALTRWVRAQAAKGATIVSICEGARVLAAADLLRGKHITTHWHALPELRKTHPEVIWVRDRRYVQDGRIISTSGVSAVTPASLALVEAIGGPAAARDAATQMGVADWKADHRTSDYGLGLRDYLRIAATWLAFWTHEIVEAPVADGLDEVALALRTDAWSRSLRATVVTSAPTLSPVTSRHGLTIIPDAKPGEGRRYVLRAADGRPGDQLRLTLADMRRRYGPGATHLAVTTLEAHTAETGVP